jgi:serine/threonine-protein kinase
MIGTMLGNRYELLEKIGEGGMALVYKAKCHLLNRYVAVKILKEQFTSDTEFVEKFKREATAVASLYDNNIVNIHDVGTEGDINYIVMEYVKGKTLKQIIQENGRLSTGRTVNIASQIAKALECAHRNNIIHRDIKPHNILVTDEGLVKVTDFGIAKVSNSVTITNSSKIMGSAHYFSPEQARGSFVDCRTDIYSLGIVIYEMVTGRVPYDADSPVSVALKHIQEQVVPPKQLNKDIPESLNRLILKAMEKEPIRRYETIKDMLGDLKKIENKQELNITTNGLDNDMTRIMDPIVVSEDYSKNNGYNKKNNYNSNEVEEYDFDEESGKGIGSDKRKTLIAIAIAMLVIVVGAVSGYFAFNKISGISTKETTVPNIVGMSQDDAKKAIEDKKLNFVVIGKEKSDKPAGTVLKTYPTEGTNVKINSDVRVSISGGQDKLGVPNLIGIDLTEAKDIITNSGLQVGNITYGFSDTISSGAVISQNPDPDSSATSNTKINLVVSKGVQIKYTTVPDVSGQNINDAESAITNAGLKVSITSTDTADKSQDGKVISQSIAAQKQVEEGTTVNLTYYKYNSTLQNSDTSANGQNNQSSNNNTGTKTAGDGTQSGSGTNTTGTGSSSSGTNNNGTGSSSTGSSTTNTGGTGSSTNNSSTGNSGTTQQGNQNIKTTPKQ